MQGLGMSQWWTADTWLVQISWFVCLLAAKGNLVIAVLLTVEA